MSRESKDRSTLARTQTMTEGGVLSNLISTVVPRVCSELRYDTSSPEQAYASLLPRVGLVRSKVAFVVGKLGREALVTGPCIRS